MFYKGACGTSEASRIPGHFVVMKGFRCLMLLQISPALEEPTTTAVNRVVADVIQVVSQVIDAVQSSVAISAGKGRNHFTGEWMDEARNAWLIGIEMRIENDICELSIRTGVIDPVEIPTVIVAGQLGRKGLGRFGVKIFIIVSTEKMIKMDLVRFAAGWFGDGRWKQPSPSPKEVGKPGWFGGGRSPSTKDVGEPGNQERLGVPHRWGGSGCSLSCTVGDGFPLPFARIQKHRFVPQFTGGIACTSLTFSVPQGYEKGNK